jgi:uroporphyrinogen decarboxylase
MTSRERVMAAYNHREPDRVPVCLGGTAQKFSKAAYHKVKAALGIRESMAGEDELDELGNVVNYHPAVLEKLGSDFRHLQVRRLPPVRTLDDGSRLHELGFALKTSESGDIVNIVTHPLAEAAHEDLPRFSWPDPQDARRRAGMREMAKELREKTSCAVALYKATLCGVFDLCCTLRGMDNFLVDLMTDALFAETLIEDAFRFTFGVYEAVLRDVGEFVDVVEFNDDLGTQENLIISPELYRTFIKPRHRQLVAMFRSHAPKAKIFLHCCGSIRDIIPDLVEIGIDILNPVQPLANHMDPALLKKEFGKSLSFQGGIDVQKAMIGTREEVRAEVIGRITAFAPGGGYVLSSANNIGSDVPVENTLALFEFARKYGTYPIRAGV